MSTKKTTSARGTKQFSLGLDFGTNSVRALIVDVSNGSEIASAASNYPSGEHGVLLDPKRPNLARQNPADYIESMNKAVRSAVRKAKKKSGFNVKRIVGIGVDATGSTPIPVNKAGTPLGMVRGFKRELDAQAWLWKDHTAHEEAAEITEKARESKDAYLAKCGGAYSSEWFWSKILHCQRHSPRVFSAAHTWVEQSDYIPAYLTGTTRAEQMSRSVCAAGHKAMYHPDWGGLPRKGFLASLNPRLSDLRDRLYDSAVPSDHPAGELTPDIARTFMLPAGLPVATGIIDAHAGAVGAGAKPGTLVKILGTSTCDMMVWPLSKKLVDIPGLAGIVPHSIIPGMYGLEAGQPAVGDIFNWFVNNLVPREFTAKGDPHANLSAEAAKLEPGESGLLALDWNNGNRSILIDPLLTGLIVGQTLHTTAPEIYRSLIEATAFGALTIIRQFEGFGCKVEQVVNCGGIAEKNDLLMQIYADVCNRPMKTSRSAETCALGAAIYGAVVGGAYDSVEEAQAAMTGVKGKVYKPRKKAVEVYAELYKLYRRLHDGFGNVEDSKPDIQRLMKDLIDLRDRVRAG